VLRDQAEMREWSTAQYTDKAPPLLNEFNRASLLSRPLDIDNPFSEDTSFNRDVSVGDFVSWYSRSLRSGLNSSASMSAAGFARIMAWHWPVRGTRVKTP
jgi:hypothetical protein